MVARIAGALLLVLGLLPIANWIPGGHDAPWYADRMALWGSGGAILAGVLVVSAIVYRRRPEVWREGLWAGLASRWQRGGWTVDLGIAVLACLTYAVVSQMVFSAKPLLIDEIIQVFQARIFAGGQLWIPTPEQPEFTAAMHLVDMEGRRFGQFPAGGPAMLMLGSLVGAEWMVGPVFAGAGVLVFARVLRRLAVPSGVALAALLLFAFGPFWLFLGGSMMNHVTATVWVLVAALGLAVAVQDGAGRWRAALGCGLALGIAATIRPMDAVAFALPTAAWLLWRARLGGAHLAALLASGVGVALPLAGLLFVNAQQTGDPLLFGYIALWGKSHELGFHEVPWGPPHTPLRGLELVNLYLLRLQTYFLETPAPALVFATASLLLVRRLEAFDRWVLASSGLLLVSYWAYWHDGFYLGPRFLLPLAPWLVLWTVRLPTVLAERGVPAWWRQGVVTAGVVALVMGGTMLLPIRARQYANGMLSMRLDADAALEAAGVPEGAVVLVRESWGAQLMARMWGLGLTRVESEGFYRSVDACRIEAILGRGERGASSAAVRSALAAAQADSAMLQALTVSTDTTARFDPRSRYTATCIARLQEDRNGFSTHTPRLVTRRDDITYLRDLHSRNLAVLDIPGERPIYLLTQATGVGGAIRLAPVSLDSATASWAREEAAIHAED
jgi:hypothetical protein